MPAWLGAMADLAQEIAQLRQEVAALRATVIGVHAADGEVDAVAIRRKADIARKAIASGDRGALLAAGRKINRKAKRK